MVGAGIFMFSHVPDADVNGSPLKTTKEGNAVGDAKCLYCENGWADTFFSFTKRVCDDCSSKTHRERIESRLCMWQQKYPPGTDFTGDGHEAPSAWAYDFWRQCDFTEDQLLKAEPGLGCRALNIEWNTIDGELVTRREAIETETDESDDHPRHWGYSLEIGNEDDLDDRAVYFWRCNTIGIPMRHWEPREGGRYVTEGVPGEWVDHPQPAWAVSEGVLLHDPTVEQVRHFIDTGEIPDALPGQVVEHP